MTTQRGFILVTPDGLIDCASLARSQGAAQYAIVSRPGDDGRMHTWGWWLARGWRCKPCEVVILSLANIDED